MELDRFTRTAVGIAAGYLAGATLVKIRGWIDRTLDEIDNAFIDFDDWEDVEDVEDEGCTAEPGHIHEVAGAVLHNGDYGMLPLVADLCYRIDEPYSIAMRLTLYVELASGQMASDSSTWEFARDLLDLAFSKEGQRVGEGDVQVEVVGLNGEVVSFYLTDARNTLRRVDVDAEPLRTFMAESFKLNDNFGENLHVDAAIRRLLDGSWQQ